MLLIYSNVLVHMDCSQVFVHAVTQFCHHHLFLTNCNLYESWVIVRFPSKIQCWSVSCWMFVQNALMNENKSRTAGEKVKAVQIHESDGCRKYRSLNVYSRQEIYFIRLCVMRFHWGAEEQRRLVCETRFRYRRLLSLRKYRFRFRPCWSSRSRRPLFRWI